MRVDVYIRIILTTIFMLAGINRLDAANISATHIDKQYENRYTRNREGSEQAPSFAECSQPLLSVSTTSGARSITPAVRTIARMVRNVERMFEYTTAVRSIDSTTAAQRYGLYNHKIIFVSLARNYYLSCLQRFII